MKFRPDIALVAASFLLLLWIAGMQWITYPDTKNSIAGVLKQVDQYGSNEAKSAK